MPLYYGNSTVAGISDFNATFSNSQIPNGGFEADTVGNDPADWTSTEAASTSIAVSNTYAIEGTQSVRVYDDSGSGKPELDETFTGISNDGIWEFSIYVDSITVDGVFVVLGGDSGDYGGRCSG